MVTTHLSPVHQAEHARQVIGVLGRIEDRFVAGGWGVGRRFLSSGATCLVGAIDEATAHTMPGVAAEVAERLAAHLPAPLRTLGRARPRLALMLYNDMLRDHGRVVDLVRSTHRGLGGSPRHPAAQRRRSPVAADLASHVTVLGARPQQRV